MAKLSTNTFTKSSLLKSDNLFSGENTSHQEVPGGDFATFGNIHGQGRLGGFVHFRARTKPPKINH